VKREISSPNNESKEARDERRKLKSWGKPFGIVVLDTAAKSNSRESRAKSDRKVGDREGEIPVGDLS